MKKKIHTQSIFQSTHTEERKKLVTLKMEKLINIQLKKMN